MEYNYVNQPEKYIVSENIINTPDGIYKQNELLHKQHNQHNKHPELNSEKYVDKHVNIGNNFLTKTVAHNNKIPSEPKIYDNEHKYDPYMAYVEKHGVNHNCANNLIRIKKHYININSAHRKTTPHIITDEVYNLTNNPLFLTQQSQNMIITHNNHTYDINDKIMLSGVNKNVVTLRSIVNNIYAAEFINGKSYITINYPHGINIEQYDTAHLYVEIKDFRGNMNNGTFVDNIPINSINNIHNILILNPDDNTFDENKFYISIPNSYSGTSNFEQFNFDLIFYYVAGIPVNTINNDFPINSNNLYGFHTIIDKTDNTYTVKLEHAAGNTITFGNEFVTVKKLTELTTNYQHPNNYEIELGHSFKNVVGAKIISSEFPNIENIIDTIKIDTKNNNLYWSNYDDGEYLYNIQIPAGNYTISDLKSTINSLCYNTPRINYENDIQLYDNINYTNHNIINLNINISNNITSFDSYKESNVVRPFTNISPIINADPSQDPTIPVINYILTVTQNNHRLSQGDEIKISGATSHMGIPSTVLNNTHTVHNILSTDTYTIKLPPFNIEHERLNTNGGNNVMIQTPNLIKLYFDKDNTVGSALGFRNVGDEHSITNYGYIIKNTDNYIFHTDYDAAGNINTITNNNVFFNRNDYMLMCCPQLNYMYSTGPIKNVFSKILFGGNFGKILFNTFVDSDAVFYDPIDEITKLNFSFYLPNGDLIDFNNMNHSFTLELVTTNEHPKNTHIHTKTGKSYYG